MSDSLRQQRGEAVAAYNGAIGYLNTPEDARWATIEDTADLIRTARESLDEALAVARAITVLAAADGVSQVAEGFHVDRMTIRKWLLK